MRGIFVMELEDEATDSEAADLGDDVTVSLHALTGIHTSDTIQLATRVASDTLHALVDSGSTHCFISTGAAQRLGLHPTPRPGLTVGVANGDRVPADGICCGVPFTIAGEPFIFDIYVIPLAGYEMILGCQWLKTLGPILWDFATHSMSFWQHDHRIKWFGMNAPSAPRLATLADRDLLALLLEEFQDLFVEPTGLPPKHHLDHHIHLLPDTAPVVVRPYRYPQLLKDELEKQCDEMLQQGIIRPSTSAFSSPVLLVRKKDNSWRFCVDFRALNAKTVRDMFPIPVVEELLDELNGATYFTKLDLRSGYHQVRMADEDIAKTAFRTHHGHFEFLVMPFGLTNAPATFQALMNTVLRPFLRRCVLVFFDDILIYSKSWSEHLHHV